MPKDLFDDVESLFGLVEDQLHKSIVQPNVLAFTPYEPSQKAVVCSQKPGRYVSGGNRAGKTTIEVVDAIWNALDVHPFRRRPAHWGHGAIKQRFVVVDIIKGVHQIILPELKRWLPASALINGSWDDSWDERHLTLTLKNKSTFQFLTHQMDLDKHGGTKLHAVYFDEEPPQDIFNENLMRLIDYDGWWMVAATSTQGIGWTYEYLVEPWEQLQQQGEEDPNLDFFTLSQLDNPHLLSAPSDRNRFYVAMSKEDREIREEGKIVSRSGTVFPQFAQHLDAFILAEHKMPPRDWEWYASVDHGFNNPTAWLWHAVAPDGRIYTFAEHYARQMTVPEHAAVVRARELAWRHAPSVRVGDPAMKQRSGITGTSPLTEYAMRGIYINVETVSNDVAAGVSKLQEYFRILSSGSPWGPDMPYWRISPNCANLIRELRKLRWAAPESAIALGRKNVEEVVYKKDDHAFDSMRYFGSILPALNTTPNLDTAGDLVSEFKHITFDQMLAKIAEDPEAYAPTAEWETERYVDDTGEFFAGMLPL